MVYIRLAACFGRKWTLLRRRSPALEFQTVGLWQEALTDRHDDDGIIPSPAGPAPPADGPHQV
jgi:hypothetical protein